MDPPSRGRGQEDDPQARWGEWMASAQAGDGAAYERLLEALLPAARGFVRSRLRDPVSTEDVVQNVLLSLHRARHTYRPERPFGPWWRAIARNAVIDFVRQHRRRAGRELPLDGPEPVDPRTAEPRPEPLSPEMRAALEALPRGQRQAVELLHVHGLSVREAAERVGISPGALKVRAHRGYHALRALLEGSRT